MSITIGKRTTLMVGTVLSAAVLFPSVALAQAADETGGLEEIIVTAQKREQSVQDVPIAVTALSEQALQANRVVSVTDLTGLAPGVTVRVSAGGSQLPSFTIRGAVSYGVVPGSDKQVSMYLDGVYISSPRGSIFELPDTQRIEMLRGPQGTLFGRNATAGAVSISTRDPNGEAGLKTELTVGNYDQARMRISVSSPEVGPFSAYYTFVHNERRGDIRNLSAGQVWDRSLSPSNIGRATSPKWLGSKDSDSHFLAVKFQPSDSFKTIYKFDRYSGTDTPDATGLVNINAAAPLTGALLQALLSSQSSPMSSYIIGNDKRPKAVHNSWAIPNKHRVFGHSLTSTWNVTDDITVKNIMAYRKTYQYAASSIDGFSGVTFTQQALIPYATFATISRTPSLAAPGNEAALGAAIGATAAALAPLVGQPFIGIATQPMVKSRQWSDELQINYDSKFLTLTAGALWFKGKDYSGGPLNMQNTLSFSVIPGGKLPLTNQGQSLNNQTSIAAYTQAEIHATRQLDIILGARITKDKKDGTFTYGSTPALNSIAFNYKKSKPNFLVGVNFKPNDDTLLYAKYSTAFVSGGSVATIDFAPETATSWEAGIKASLLDNRLQANLAVYTATYKNFQTAQGSASFGPQLRADLESRGFDAATAAQLVASLGTFVYSQGGPVKNTGFEFDFTAAPAQGFTMGGSLSYSKTKFKDVSPLLLAGNGGFYEPTLRPSWTGGLWGQYEIPLGGDDTRLVLRADGSWRSKQRTDANPNRNVAVFAPLQFSEATWLVNSRAAIKGIDIGGVQAEVGIWAKNLTNDKSITFNLINGGFEASANYQAARTIGADLIMEF